MNRPSGGLAALVVVHAASSSLGCGGTVNANRGDGPQTADGSGPLGSITVQMTLPPNTYAANASYTLSAPSGFSRSDSRAIPSTSTVELAIDQVPAASGYTLDVTVGNGASDECQSTAEFAVVAMTTTLVVLVPHCAGISLPPPAVGNLAVSGEDTQSLPLGTLYYSIVGPSGIDLHDSTDVGNSSSFGFTLGNLPTGQGFVLAIRATTKDDSYVCTGATTFNVDTNATTKVSLLLQCNPTLPADAGIE